MSLYYWLNLIVTVIFKGLSPLNGRFNDDSLDDFGTHGVSLISLSKTSIGMIVIKLTVFTKLRQQVLDFYPCLFNDTNSIATVPTSNYARVGLGTHTGVFTASLKMGSQSALNAGIFESVPRDVSPFCPTGNCTFPVEYASAGWCSRCTDISEHVQVLNHTYTFQQFNITETGSQFNYTLPSSNITATIGQNFVLEQPDSWLKFQAIMANYIFYSDNHIDTDWTRRGYGAAECTFYPCVRRHSAKVRFGVFSESVVTPPAEMLFSQTSGTKYASVIDIHCLNELEKSSLQQGGYDLGDDETWLNYNLHVNAQDAYNPDSTFINTSLTNIRPECIYQTSRIHSTSLGNFLMTLLPGRVSANAGFGISGTSSAIETIFNESNISFDSIDDVFSRIAQSITAWNRQDNDSSEGKVATGSVLRAETCVRAQWLWLIYPAAMALGTIVFLSWAIIHTSRYGESRQNYKTALLPLMFTCLDGLDDERHSQPAFEPLVDVEKRAQAMDVRLEKTASGWKFVVVGRT